MCDESRYFFMWLKQMRTGLCYFKTAETVLTCTFSYICFKVIECSTVSVCMWVFRMSKIKIHLLEMFSQVAWDRHSVYHKFLVVRWCWKLLIVNNWTSCCTWDLLQCSKQYLYNIIFPPAPPTKNKKALWKRIVISSIRDLLDWMILFQLLYSC